MKYSKQNSPDSKSLHKVPDSIIETMKETKQKLSEYFNIKEASEFLGVHKDTLRRWEKLEKLKSLRNPMNNYRLYKIKDLEQILSNAGEDDQ
jgi:hypothetical protein